MSKTITIRLKTCVADALFRCADVENRNVTNMVETFIIRGVEDKIPCVFKDGFLDTVCDCGDDMPPCVFLEGMSIEQRMKAFIKRTN